MFIIWKKYFRKIELTLVTVVLVTTFISNITFATEQRSNDCETLHQSDNYIEQINDRIDLEQYSPSTKEEAWIISEAQKAHLNYYGTPYTDSDTITSEYGVVHRPNHGLVHGIRQTLLIRSITLMIAKYDTGKFGNWLRAKLSSDPLYLRKILLAGIYLRAARWGEASSGGDLLLQKSKALFTKVAAKSGLFTDTEELKVFAHAHLVDPDPHKGEPDDLAGETLSTEQEKEKQFLASLFNIGHLSDHRRMAYWDTGRSFSAQIGFLTKHNIPKTLSQKFVEALWDRSGDFLNLTGQGQAPSRPGLTDKVWGIKTYGWHNIRDDKLFFHLENNPKDLVNLVYTEGSKSIDID